MLDLKLALVGNLDEYYKSQRTFGAKAVTTAMRRAAAGLKRELRRQVRSAGLDRNSAPGRSVEKSFQDKVYPQRRFSLGAASLVYSKFPRAIEAFDKGAVITAKNGKWLAIPTGEAGKKGNKRMQPKDIFSRFKLRFVQTRNPALALLVGKSSSSNKDVVFFYLHRQVHIKKRLNINDAAEKWLDKLPGYILSEWDKADVKIAAKATALLNG